MKNLKLQTGGNYQFEPRLIGFKVYELGSEIDYHSHKRTDCYKISMISGFALLNCEDGFSLNDGTLLLFGSPSALYSYEIIKPLFEGYTCVFTNQFIEKNDDSFSPEHRLLFQNRAFTTIKLNDEQREHLTTLFKRMLLAMNEDYRFTDNLILTYVQIVMHEAFKIYLAGFDLL